jgi:hypothetical protein
MVHGMDWCLRGRFFWLFCFSSDFWWFSFWLGVYVSGEAFVVLEVLVNQIYKAVKCCKAMMILLEVDEGVLGVGFRDAY